MRQGRRDRLGPLGERLAARALRRRGLRVLGRNLVTPMGEADLLCEDARGGIVLVEVKARRVGGLHRAGAGSRTIGPEASVTQAKRRRLVRILEHLVRANGWHDRPRRIDVVAVRVQARRWWWPRVEVVHYEDAVLAGGQPRGASRPPRSGAGRPPDPPGTDRS